MQLTNIEITRGDVVLLRPDTTVGREQKGTRPAVIVQNNIGNQHSPITVIVPLTDSEGKKKYPFMAEIKKGEGGVRKDCFALANQVRAIDRSRIIELWGHLPDKNISEVDAALRDELDL